MKKIIKEAAIVREGITLRYILIEAVRGEQADYLFNISAHSDNAYDIRQVGDICDNESEAILLFDRMVEGYVTPETLGEIAEDYIFEKTCASRGDAAFAAMRK